MSLIELMIVVGLIVLLMALLVPSMSSLVQGQGTKRAINDVSGLLEIARTEAMATSTWVWVGFAQQTNAARNTEMVVCAVSSKDGTATTAATNLARVARPARIENVVLLSTLTSWATNEMIVPLKSGSYRFEEAIGGQNRTFAGTVIAFSPQGEASLSPDKIDPWIEVGLRESRGGVENTNKTASLRISGLSGQVLVSY